jgi:hypothetical protein
MSEGWAWVSGIVVALAIIALLGYGQSQREAYWARRAAVVLHVQETEKPDRIVFWRIAR